MAGELPAISGKHVIQSLSRSGFVVNRIVGSHHFLVRRGEPNRAVAVPVHGNRDLKRGTIRSIIRQAGLSVEEFTELL